MPNYENNNLHGVLYITFDIEFPKKEYSEEDKESKKIIILIFKSQKPTLSHSFTIRSRSYKLVEIET